MAHRNWSRVDKSWHLIDLLPAKMPPAILFSDASQTKQWLVEQPRGATKGHDVVHLRDEADQLRFDEDGAPVTADEVHEPAFFAFVTLHDKAAG